MTITLILLGATAFILSAWVKHSERAEEALFKIGCYIMGAGFLLIVPMQMRLDEDLNEYITLSMAGFFIAAICIFLRVRHIHSSIHIEQTQKMNKWVANEQWKDFRKKKEIEKRRAAQADAHRRRQENIFEAPAVRPRTQTQRHH